MPRTSTSARSTGRKTEIALPYQPAVPFKRVIWHGPGEKLDEHTERFKGWAMRNGAGCWYAGWR
jgi:hypothetical protein